MTLTNFESLKNYTRQTDKKISLKFDIGVATMHKILTKNLKLEKHEFITIYSLSRSFSQKMMIVLDGAYNDSF